MPDVQEAWNEVTHYVVHALEENPNASVEDIEGKIAESLFNDGFSEDIQNEVMEDVNKLNKIIEDAKEVEVKEACVNIANKLDALGFIEEASMVDDIVMEASSNKNMIKKAALFNEQDLRQYADDYLAKEGLTLDQAIERDIKSFGDDDIVIKEYQKWVGRGIATPDNAQDFIEERHYSYNVFNIIAERFGWDMRLRDK